MCKCKKFSCVRTCESVCARVWARVWVFVCWCDLHMWKWKHNLKQRNYKGHFQKRTRSFSQTTEGCYRRWSDRKTTEGCYRRWLDWKTTEGGYRRWLDWKTTEGCYRRWLDWKTTEGCYHRWLDWKTTEGGYRWWLDWKTLQWTGGISLSGEKNNKKEKIKRWNKYFISCSYLIQKSWFAVCVVFSGWSRNGDKDEAEECHQRWVTVMSHSDESQRWVTAMSHSDESRLIMVLQTSDCWIGLCSDCAFLLIYCYTYLILIWWWWWWWCTDDFEEWIMSRKT